MEPMINRVIDNLNILIKKNSKIVVALSGGKDSIALLNILLDLKEEFNIEVSCCYVNHNLRGSESAEEELFVKRYCKKQKIKLYSLSVPASYWSNIGRDSIEMAARKIRYDFFKKVAILNKINYIALAHHLNDKIETFFLQILRTGGLETLSSIPFKNKKIIRPFLNIKKEEIESYVIENNLPFIDDSTNSKNIYKRNIVRNKLIPIIEELNPGYKKSISNLFTIIEEENYFIQKQVSKSYKNVLISESKNFICFDKKEFLSNELVIQKHLIKRVLKKLNYPTKVNQILLKILTGTKERYFYKKGDFYCKSLGNFIWFINVKNIGFLNKPIVINSQNYEGKIRNNKFKFELNKVVNVKDNFTFSNFAKLPITIRNVLPDDSINILSDTNKKVIKILKDSKIPSMLFNRV
ncbi:MAG TPA: tRNA lysidine(34) synthetase TilS, partial [Spirochaetota bacterium]|nr:tRNA lysidine(34) synthetase TilS [Spirochaetota bacterium]